MAGVVSFCDVRGALRAWSSGQAALAGAGKPITNGLHLSARGSPGHGTYGVITRVIGDDHPGGAPIDTPNISISLWGPDWGTVEAAAIALARALRGMVQATVTTDRGEQVTLLMAGSVSMVQQADGTRPRYIVAADVWAAPA